MLLFDALKFLVTPDALWRRPAKAGASRPAYGPANCTQPDATQSENPNSFFLARKLFP